jgi:hypothetical protein
MVIEINTDKLLEMSLSADEFVYLTILNRGAIELFKEQPLNLNIDLEKLQTNGWVKLGEEDSVVLRDKFISSITGNFTRMWHDLLSRYPLKVTANGGVRILRAKEPDSKANEKAKGKYQKIVKEDIVKHNFIMQCLERELDIRRRGNSLGFMQMLETWLNNHSWEKYSDLSDTNSKSTESGRITRQL